MRVNAHAMRPEGKLNAYAMGMECTLNAYAVHVECALNSYAMRVECTSRTLWHTRLGDRSPLAIGSPWVDSWAQCLGDKGRPIGRESE